MPLYDKTFASLPSSAYSRTQGSDRTTCRLQVSLLPEVGSLSDTREGLDRWPNHVTHRAPPIGYSLPLGQQADWHQLPCISIPIVICNPNLWQLTVLSNTRS